MHVCTALVPSGCQRCAGNHDFAHTCSKQRAKPNFGSRERSSRKRASGQLLALTEPAAEPQPLQLTHTTPATATAIMVLAEPRERDAAKAKAFVFVKLASRHLDGQNKFAYVIVGEDGEERIVNQTRRRAGNGSEPRALMKFLSVSSEGLLVIPDVGWWAEPEPRLAKT